MSRKSDTRITEALQRALVANDLAAARAALDDATVLHMPGRSGLAGDYQGRGPILGLFTRMAEITGGTLRFRPSRVVCATDEAIVVWGVESAVRGHLRLATRTLHLYSLDDCAIREVWVFHENQDRVDGFWMA